MNLNKILFFLMSFYGMSFSFSQNTNEEKTEEEFIEIIEEQDSASVEKHSPSCGPIGIMAEFPGGYPKMMNFITDNFRLPEIAIEQIEYSTVYVQFTVEKNGEISNINIVRGAHKEIDKEVIRVVKLMPNWTPEIQNGKSVRSKFTLPIKIHLN